MSWFNCDVLFCCVYVFIAREMGLWGWMRFGTLLILVFNLVIMLLLGRDFLVFLTARRFFFFSITVVPHQDFLVCRGTWTWHSELFHVRIELSTHCGATSRSATAPIMQPTLLGSKVWCSNTPNSILCYHHSIFIYLSVRKTFIYFIKITS